MLVHAKSNRTFVIFIFIVSILLRLIFFAVFLKNNPCMLKFDSEHYHKIALQIVAGNGFSDERGCPQFYRVPGYPLFLAVCYKIFGISQNFVFLMQILLSSFISILIFLLALVLFPGQYGVARLAALISCFDIGYIIFPGLILTEILFVLFFMVFLILFLRNLTFIFENKHSLNNYILELFLAGFFLGVACLVRQVAPAMVGISIFLLLFSYKKFNSILSFMTGFLLATGWWLFRNFCLTGYIFFGTLSGPHFLNHAVAQLEMMQKNISYKQAQINVQQKFNYLVEQRKRDFGRPLQEIEQCLIAEYLTIKYSLRHSFITIKLYLINILKTAFGLYSSELLFIDSNGQLPEYSNERGLQIMIKRFLVPRVSNFLIIPIIYLEIILFIFVLLGFLIFCFSALFDFAKFCIAFKVLAFVGSILFITLACGYARLRLPIECFLITLASKSWFDILKRGS